MFSFNFVNNLINMSSNSEFEIMSIQSDIILKAQTASKIKSKVLNNFRNFMD